MSDKKQNYELAFHLTTNMEDARVGQIKQELENLITAKGGVIAYSKEPERTRLSYPIENQSNTYFGYIHFNLPSPEEALKELCDHLKLNNDILRYLLIKMPSDLQKGRDMLKQLKMKERAERKPKTVPKAPVSEKEEKELEEKLEEIIEKL